jgi:hypothetical protein
LVRNAISQFVLPYAEHAPTRRLELRRGISVTQLIRGNLLRPVRRVLARLRSMLGATVPVAAINEDRDPLAREDNICSTLEPRNWRNMELVAKAPPVKSSTQQHLGTRVTRLLP